MLQAYLMKWTESRRAEGRYETDEDGFSLHVSPEFAADYVNTHLEQIRVANLPSIAAPDVYSRPTSFTGELTKVLLNDEALVTALSETGSLRFPRGSEAPVFA